MLSTVKGVCNLELLWLFYISGFGSYGCAPFLLDGDVVLIFMGRPTVIKKLSRLDSV